MGLLGAYKGLKPLLMITSSLRETRLLGAYKGLKQDQRHGIRVPKTARLLGAYKGLKHETIETQRLEERRFIRCL